MAIVFDTVSAKQLIRNLLHIPEKLFQVQAGYVKYKSYTTVHVMGNIKIYSDCMPTENNPYGLGSYMVLSGKGCDQLQTYLESDRKNYADFFKECIERYRKKFHFTRIDIAIDDKNMIPYFTIEKIKEKCSNHEFLSKSRNFRFQESSFQDGSTALTVYIGDRKSRISYRFYDKDKEQAGKINIPLSGIGTWKRTEMELKDEIAQSFIERVAEMERSLRELASDFLGTNLRFVDYDGNQKNKSRWKTSQFWNDFLGDIKPLKIAINSNQNSLTEEELGEFLRIPSHNACSTKRAIKILDLVCQDAVKERDYQFGRDAIVQSIVRNMRFNGQELEKLEKVQARLLEVLNYHLETIPGISNVTACVLVGNIGDIQRFTSADKLANFAGVAPICHSSAEKGRNVQNKTQGNRELYNVLYFLAIQQIYVSSKGEARNPVLRAYFKYKVSQGKTKIQALICIMRRLIRVIYSMMKYKTEYKMPEIKEQMIS